ncbi:MAG: substrate-binding domain-containing protein [Lachnospiraceae bacterium]|nr:substrate-binding domain-containing protein [Lachnospiraceae bacterium]
MKKRLLAAVMASLMAFTLTSGCGPMIREPQEEVESSEEDEGLTIGMSFDSFLIERWQRDRDVFVDQCNSLGAKVNVQNANGDIDTQISQIEYLISKQVDCIVVVGIDADAISNVCAKAKDSGIPVIAYDRMIYYSDVDLYISFDNKQVGTLMGQALANYCLKNKAVPVLAGPNEDPNVAQLDEGFREVMKKRSIRVRDEIHTPGWRPEYAADYINEHLDLLDEVDGIMCGNDGIATAVYRVLAEKRKAGRIKLVGQDADLEACQRVVQGTQVMTVFKPVEKLARAAAEYAVRLAQGDCLDEIEDTMYDGSHDVPCVLLDPVAVYKDNMDSTVIDGGYHFREDVYLYDTK